MIPVLWTILDQNKRPLSTGDHEFYMTDRESDAYFVASRARQLQPGREFEVYALCFDNTSLTKRVQAVADDWRTRVGTAPAGSFIRDFADDIDEALS